jgi:CubicO group peptidase (beta-lactamase class C family)
MMEARGIHFMTDGVKAYTKRIRSVIIGLCLLNVLLFASIIAQSPAQAGKPAMPGLSESEAAPESIGLDANRLKYIDDAVEAAIREEEVPGAVILVGRKGGIGYFKAFGNRSLQPTVEKMTRDTIFDVSSLTKVMATTPSIMILVEKGIVRLGDRVQQYLPLFRGEGKDPITVRQLLTHYSGLPADFDLSKDWFGREAALEALWKIRAEFEPDKTFVYSDLNFIALGEIVRAAGGKPLDEFAGENIFLPLGMKETFFRPPASLAGRIAPTETRLDTLRYLHGSASKASFNKMLRGEVHDPTAWRMDGVAGHAGLFSTARDVAVYAQMLLDQGAYPGGRLLSPLAVQAMSRSQSPSGSPQVRGYGWDIESDYSSPRGDLFSGGFGHTGFTGASLWIHPPSRTFVVILSNRVHPKGGKSLNHLRGAVANIVASAISDPF